MNFKDSIFKMSLINFVKAKFPQKNHLSPAGEQDQNEEMLGPCIED